MPGFFEALTFIFLSFQAGSISGVLAGAGALFGGLGNVVGVGLSLLSSLIYRPKQPRPEDVQTSVRNPTAIRHRHYGRVKTSGPWVFAESEDGDLHKVVALGTGEIDAIEEFWIDDKLVAIDEDGNAEDAPYVRNGDPKLIVQHRLGTASQTHYADLAAVFPEWTSEHVGNGVASLYIRQKAVNRDSLQRVFPNGIITNYRVVARGSKVYNPVTEATEWNDNAAAIIRDYLIHPDGLRLPLSIVETPLARAGWIAAYNRANEPVALKAGGTAPRYRLWGSYAFDERPADVLGRMLACCDGRFVPTPDGGVTLDIGAWSEPSVTVDASMIVGFSGVARGRDVLTTANVVKATYMSPTHDYQSTDAEAWSDEEDIAVRGEIIRDTQFLMAPSHSQARRLMKLEAYRANPSWVGTFECNLRALAAFVERFIRIEYPLFGIDEVFEVRDFRLNLDQGILRSVTLQVQSMPEEAYQWDAATEEGDPPIYEETVVDKTIPLPDNFSFVVDRIVVGDAQVPYGVLQFDPPPNESLVTEGHYKKTSDTNWTVVPIGDDAEQGQTGALSDGGEYEAQVRHVTITGRRGEWTESETVTVTADPTPPAVVTGVSGVGTPGQASINWTSPNSGNYVAANIRRNTVDNEGTASLVRREYGPPATADIWVDGGLAPGDYYYWLRASNGSNVESASVATGVVAVA